MNILSAAGLRGADPNDTPVLIEDQPDNSELIKDGPDKDGPGENKVGKTMPADMAALEKENQILRARIADLERLVRRDNLTPLFNRRHFLDILGKWIARTRRYGGNSAIFFIDVDHLKRVNDQYGHDAGDQLLIGIAQILGNYVRQSDVAARIGGDEFGLLLENITAEELPAKAEKLTIAVAGQRIDYKGHRLPCSISVGYAAIEADVPAAIVLQRADRSMYQSKLGKAHPA